MESGITYSKQLQIDVELPVPERKTAGRPIKRNKHTHTHQHKTTTCPTHQQENTHASRRKQSCSHGRKPAPTSSLGPRFGWLKTLPAQSLSGSSLSCIVYLSREGHDAAMLPLSFVLSSPSPSSLHSLLSTPFASPSAFKEPPASPC